MKTLKVLKMLDKYNKLSSIKEDRDILEKKYAIMRYLRQVPVRILTFKKLTDEDIKALEFTYGNIEIIQGYEYLEFDVVTGEENEIDLLHKKDDGLYRVDIEKSNPIQGYSLFL